LVIGATIIAAPAPATALSMLRRVEIFLPDFEFIK
jgi:hypothetical protein